jgi:hypothetical protein
MAAAGSEVNIRQSSVTSNAQSQRSRSGRSSRAAREASRRHADGVIPFTLLQPTHCNSNGFPSHFSITMGSPLKPPI